MLLLVWRLSHTDLGPEEKSLHVVAKNISGWFEVLRAGVKGPCFHRPENWLVKQLIDEPKLVYKVGIY
jgi:hypothetical protein